MKKITLQTLFGTLLLLTILLHFGKTIYATTDNPGEGRLSGRSIPSEFYETEELTPSLSIPLQLYGSRKLTSPYTKVKYTHQTRFDSRTILHGIDISRWQGEIDWQKVKAAGIDYAFIQVGFRGYGSSGILDDTTKDPYFDTNMENAITAGIRVGVYVFSQAITEAEAIEEANYILDALQGYDISMPLVLDYEYASTSSGLGGRLYKAKLSKKEATNICMAFCKEIAAAGYTPMVYANKSMLSDEINATTLTDAGYRIWLANYTKKTTYSGVFDFWQYSEKGKVKGINGYVDMNFYYAQSTDDFTLAPNSISKATFTEIADYTYTGDAITPEVQVTLNGITLTPNVDYTLSYTNNTKIGTATIQITGIGAYCDTRNIRFDILPDTVSSLKAKKRTNKYITLSWKKDNTVSGYQIYRSTKQNGTFKRLKTITKKSTTSYKNTKLSAGTCYYYKIRSYKKVNGKTYYGAFSPVVHIYTKTGYTKNAIAKKKTAIYDCIPGTKKETITETVLPETTETTESETTETETTESQTTETDTTETETTESETTETETTETETTESQTTETETTESQTTETQTTTITKTVSVDSTILTQVSKNQKMKVIYSTKYKKTTWYYVSYTKNGTTYKGFVSNSNVTTAKLGKIVKTKKVNVRKKATVYSKKVTSLNRNTKVDILSTKKKYGVTWYKVAFKKKNKTYKGWIAAPYIKVI